MTLYQFNALDEGEQMEVLWDSSVQISERDDKVYRYILYSVFDFYVELKYHRELEVLHGSRHFSSTTPLEPYLDNIDISNLKP